MEMITGLFIVGMIIIVGLIAQYLFQRFRVPDVLVLILFGSLLSFMGLTEGFDPGNRIITFMIIFSLIYVVFYGALPIRLNAIFSTMKYSFLSALLNFIFITAALSVISHFLGFSWTYALALGALFCVMDGSVINSMLEIIKVGDKAQAEVQAESAIVDILVIVGVMTIVNFSTATLNNVVLSLTSYLLLSGAIGLVAAMLWSFALRHIGEYSSAPIATMSVLVMVYAFAEYVHANGVITVFAFSIVLSNAWLWSQMLDREQKGHVGYLGFHTKSFFKDISFLIRSFLFVYLGILVDMAQWKYLFIGLAFFALAYIIRALVKRLVRDKDIAGKDAYFIEAMFAKGLTPTIIIAVIDGSAKFINTIIGGIFFSVLISSAMVLLIDKGKATSLNELMDRLGKKGKPEKKPKLKDRTTNFINE